MMDVKTGLMHYAYGITDLRCLLVSLRKCKSVKSCEFIVPSPVLVFHSSESRFHIKGFQDPLHQFYGNKMNNI